MYTPQQPPEFVALCDNYACYRPFVETTLEKAVGLVDDVLRYCKENEIPGVLVNLTGFSGYVMPNISDRFFFISRWADTAAGKVAMAIVAPAEMILPDKIGIMIATNRGLRSEAFTDEAEALEWLRAAVPTASNVTGTP